MQDANRNQEDIRMLVAIMILDAIRIVDVSY